MLVFFDLEGLVLFLETDGELHVNRAFGRFTFLVVFVLDILARVLTHVTGKASLQVDQGHGVPVLVQHQHRRNLRRGLLRGQGVVGTKGGRRVHDARTVLRGDEVPGDHPEGVLPSLVGLCVRQQLLISYIQQVLSPALLQDAIGYGLVLRLVFLQGLGSGHLPVLIAKLVAKQVLCQHHVHGLEGILVVGAHHHVVDLPAHGERRVGRQRPGRGRPGQEVQVSVHVLQEFGERFRDRPELGHDRGVGNILVGPGLVQLVGAESRARLGRVGLNGVSFVQQSFLVQLFQKPPQGLHVFRLIGHIGFLHVHPVPHLLGQVLPDVRKAHHRLLAGLIVFLDADLLPDVLLGDSQFLLYSQLDGQTVGVPSGLALHHIALHGLVAAEEVLDGPRHHVVNSGKSVGRRWALIEYERIISLSGGDALMKNVILLPEMEYVFGCFCQIQAFVFFEVLSHVRLEIPLSLQKYIFSENSRSIKTKKAPV